MLPSVTCLTGLVAIEKGLLPAVIINNGKRKVHCIEERMAFYNVPGVSIAVIENNEIAWCKSYGYADNERKVAVGRDTAFQGGSISKPVTAWAILKLAEKHGLNLDENVNAYLKDWTVPENDHTTHEKVTIRRLLNHSAGINVAGVVGYKRQERLPTVLEILNGAGGTPKIQVQSVPGTSFAYSGGGYVILQKLVEDVAGAPFEVCMKNELFDTLGMVSSTFDQGDPSGGSGPPARSHAHDKEGRAYQGQYYAHSALGAAGLWSTPADLANFCLAIHRAYGGKSGAYLSPATAKDMLTANLGWGLGVGIRGEGENTFCFHAGKNAGFNSLMLYCFKKGIGIVIMTNGDQGATLKDEIVRSFAAHYGLEIMPPRRIRTVRLGKDSLRGFAGKYQYEEFENYFLHVSIDKKNNLVLYDPNDGKINTFVPVKENCFVDRYNGDEAVFTRNEEAGENWRIFYNNAYTFTKVDAGNPTGSSPDGHA